MCCQFGDMRAAVAAQLDAAHRGFFGVILLVFQPEKPQGRERVGLLLGQDGEPAQHQDRGQAGEQRGQQVLRTRTRPGDGREHSEQAEGRVEKAVGHAKDAVREMVGKK